jgi:hypothetical protein
MLSSLSSTGRARANGVTAGFTNRGHDAGRNRRRPGFSNRRIGQSWSESAVCLLDPRRRCRQQAAQGVEAEVVDGLRQACGSDDNQACCGGRPARLRSVSLVVRSESQRRVRRGFRSPIAMRERYSRGWPGTEAFARAYAVSKRRVALATAPGETAGDDAASRRTPGPHWTICLETSPQDRRRGRGLRHGSGL